MGSLKCEKHKLDNNFIFYLKKGYNNSLAYKKCFIVDQKHNGHTSIMIKFFMENNQHEFEKIFDPQYIQTMNNSKNTKEFVQQLDNKFNKYLDEREKQF